MIKVFKISHNVYDTMEIQHKRQ